MADFCTVCSHQLFGDIEPEIDIEKLFGELKEGYYFSVLCESCGMKALLKLEGKRKVFFYEDDNQYDYSEELILKRYEDGHDIKDEN